MMKFPVKLAIVSLASMVLVVGLTAGTGFASSMRSLGSDSAKSSSALWLNSAPHQEEGKTQFHNSRRQARRLVQVVAEALDLEVSEVVAQLKEGKTLAQIITDNNGDVDAVIQSMVDQLRQKLQEKVDDNEITQDQMDQRLAKAEARITRIINGEYPSKADHREGQSRAFDRQLRGRSRGNNSGFNATSARFSDRASNRLENLTSRLQAAVDSGRITQEQMDQRLTRFEEGRLSGFPGQGQRGGLVLDSNIQ